MIPGVGGIGVGGGSGRNDNDTMIYCKAIHLKRRVCSLHGDGWPIVSVISGRHKKGRPEYHGR